MAIDPGNLLANAVTLSAGTVRGGGEAHDCIRLTFHYGSPPDEEAGPIHDGRFVKLEALPELIRQLTSIASQLGSGGATGGICTPTSEDTAS